MLPRVVETFENGAKQKHISVDGAGLFNNCCFLNYFQFVLRESARKCGIWENPPLMREINMKTLEVFTKKVYI